MHRELTDAQLRAISLPERGQRITLYDSRQRGLELRVSSSRDGNGTFRWSAYGRLKDGGKTRVALGEWPGVSIAQARKKAQKVLADIDGGGDPMAKRRTAKAARAARAKEATVAQRFMEWREAKDSEWSARHSGEVKRIASREIEPTLGKKLLIETTRGDWTNLVAKKRRSAPAMASLLYRVCSAFLNYAEASGWGLATMPRKGQATLAPTVASRSRVLSDDELKKVWHASATLSPRQRTFLRFLIMSACRVETVSDLEIGEIDRERGRWTIPALRLKGNRQRKASGQPLVLPLTRLLLNEIDSIWPDKANGQSKPLRIRGYSKLKSALDQACNISEGWRLHDLRRTARTGMARLGVTPAAAEAVLNHVSARSQLERVYDRHNYAEEVIGASLRWQTHVENLVTSCQLAEAIPLRKT